MANIGFENTLPDLRDCPEHIKDDLSPSEAETRKNLIEVCRKIVDASPSEAEARKKLIEACRKIVDASDVLERKKRIQARQAQ